jgi:enamidase
MPIRHSFLCLATSALLSVGGAHPGYALAQEPGSQVRPFVSVDAPVVALAHARVIDGTGTPAVTDRTVILRNGLIETVGPDGDVVVPPEALVVDLSGKTLLPGFVMLHEHMFYPAGGGMYNELGCSTCHA